MNIPPFWLNLLKEAHDAEALQVAKEVLNAYSAEAEANALHEEHKEGLDTWDIWNCYRAQRTIEKLTEALNWWYGIVEHLFDCDEDIFEVLGVEIEVLRHACFRKQVHLADRITILLVEQREWHHKQFNSLGLDAAATLFAEEEQGESTR